MPRSSRDEGSLLRGGSVSIPYPYGQELDKGSRTGRPHYERRIASPSDLDERKRTSPRWLPTFRKGSAKKLPRQVHGGSELDFRYSHDPLFDDSLVASQAPRLNVDEFLTPAPQPLVNSTGSVEEFEEGQLQDLVDQLKQMDEYFSNVDVAHVGRKLLDRDDMAFLCKETTQCPHVPSFHKIYQNFQAVMPQPTQTFVERDRAQEARDMIAELLAEAKAELDTDASSDVDDEEEEEEEIISQTSSIAAPEEVEAPQIVIAQPTSQEPEVLPVTPAHRPEETPEESPLETPKLSARGQGEQMLPEPDNDEPPMAETPVPYEPAVEVTVEPAVEVIQEPVVEVAEEPAVEVAEEPAVEVAEEPVVEVAEEPIVEVTEEPVVEVAAEPVAEVTEEPVVEVAKEPVVEVAYEPVAEVTEEPAVEVTEEPVVEVTEEPVVSVTEEPVVEVTDSTTMAIDAPEEVSDTPVEEDKPSSEVVESTVPIAMKTPDVSEQPETEIKPMEESTGDKPFTPRQATMVEDLDTELLTDSPVLQTHGDTVVRIPIFQEETVNRSLSSTSPMSSIGQICGSVLASAEHAWHLSSPRWATSLLSDLRTRSETCSVVALERNYDCRQLWFVGAQLEDQSGNRADDSLWTEAEQKLSVQLAVNLGGLCSMESDTLSSVDGSQDDDRRVEYSGLLRRHSAFAVSEQVTEWATRVVRLNLGAITSCLDAIKDDGRRAEYRLNNKVSRFEVEPRRRSELEEEFERRLRTAHEVRVWAAQFEALHRMRRMPLRSSHSRYPSSPSAQTSPLDQVRLRQAERIARLDRDAYHANTEKKFQEQLEAVRKRMRMTTQRRLDRGRFSLDSVPPSPVTAPPPPPAPVQQSTPDFNSAMKISQAQMPDQLRTAPLPPKRQQLPRAKPEQTSTEPVVTDFRHVLRKTGRLEALARTGTPKAQSTSVGGAVLEHKAIKPSDARNMFERKAREQKGETSEWFLKQVSKYQKA